jgi:hypothetical protein
MEILKPINPVLALPPSRFTSASEKGLNIFSLKVAPLSLFGNSLPA